uniref:Uncharacterized protein n=1 Tax=Cryptococcus bacillisporus CA1280 TaxID=1296109 RepID=A0A0D0VM94_CRYGA|nr:hypothetical protein I312_02297 [Cryptococcus bacillisporus CA1280]
MYRSSAPLGGRLAYHSFVCHHKMQSHVARIEYRLGWWRYL